MIGKLVDTHFHLDYYKNHRELYQTINTLQQYTLCMTNSPGVFVSCKHLYAETKYLKFALGFHPQNQSLSLNDFNDFLMLLSKTKYVGEIGMDFSSTKFIEHELQVKYFEKIIEICSAEDKLISVHLRESESEAIKIIQKYRPQKCIIHWFSGNTSQLKELAALGCYFSINSNMVQSAKSQARIMKIPLDKILVESDGPFTKVLNHKYTPDQLINVYQVIGSHFGIPEFINQVYKNFHRVLSQ